jgi:hypothetical protein
MTGTDGGIPTAAPAVSEAELEAGARNLLVGCIGVEPGQDVLFVREDSGHGYYDAAAGDRVEEEARRLGARVLSVWADPIAGPEGFPKPVAAAMQHVEHTIFFSRIGDQLRFSDLPGPGTKTMTYALDAGYLGSEFCTVPHALMEEVLARLHAELDRASEWRITCPLGTDISGGFEPLEAAATLPGGFTLLLFPVTTFRPISCRAASGSVALAHWLMATGTHMYEPYALMLDRPVTVRVEDGRIAGFEGDPEVVAKVRAHYAAVAEEFGIDPDVVHSWHAGIHPKTFYSGPATANIERWGGISFGSPRYLHFHTCGDYAPGEIAWSIFDQTITVDGVPFWQDGRFVFLERDDLQALLRDYPGAEAAFEMRSDIGI